MRIHLDTSEIEKALGYLTDGVVRPAVKMALNDSGRQGDVAGRKELGRKWNLTAKFIKDRVGISAFANENDLTLTIQANGRPIDLTHFGARWVQGNRILRREGNALGVQTRKRKIKGGGGVFYEAAKGEPGHLPSAFIAQVKAGKSDTHVGVFVREGKTRLKIINKKLITVSSMFEQQPVFDAIEKVVATKFPERFDHHIDRAVEKHQGTP